MFLLLAALAACSTPRNPYYPDLEEPARKTLLSDSDANTLTQFIGGLLEAILAKNT